MTPPPTPRRRARWTPALAALCLVALAGCGDDAPESGGSEPTASASESETPAETPAETPDQTTGGPDDAGEEQTCAGVGQAALVRATGTAQQLLEPSGSGDAVRCGTGVDERGMRTEWEVRPVIGDLAVEGENAELPGLRRTRVQLGGGADTLPAWQLTGTVAGSRLAFVITVLPGERTAVVQAGDDGDSTADVTDEQLLEAARGVAQEIVRTDAGSDGATEGSAG